MSSGRIVLFACALLVCAGAAPQAKPDITISATTDKTAADVGDPITLTLTLAGNLHSVEPPQLSFPPALHVASQMQSTNIAIKLGEVEKSLSYAFVLIATEPGTYQLGPFRVTKDTQTYATDPITITIKQSAVPKNLEPAERLSI